jgi:hypothetical protein
MAGPSPRTAEAIAIEVAHPFAHFAKSLSEAEEAGIGLSTVNAFASKNSNKYRASTFLDQKT